MYCSFYTLLKDVLGTKTCSSISTNLSTNILILAITITAIIFSINDWLQKGDSLVCVHLN